MTDVVATTAGRVRGRRGEHARAWLGIPYAAPPVGPLRFAAPSPPQQWHGEREAVQFGDSPLQTIRRRGHLRMSEDCLTLNVYTPAADDAGRPVLVWFYGGGFVMGTSADPMLDGRRLAARGDLVVVTVNYRVGALGFVDMSGVDGSAADNPGMRDVIAALEWVRDNIAGFGGDPGRVTVAGQSAGACIVTTLLTIPGARGLFHRAISHSSPANSAHSPDQGHEMAGRLLRLLGVPAGDLAALRALDPRALVEGTEALVQEVLAERPGLNPLMPVVGRLIPRHPYAELTSGRGAPVPLLVGSTDDEATLFERSPVPLTPVTEADIRRLLDLTDPDHAAQIVAAYPGFPGRSARLRLSGDARYGIPALRVAEGHAARAPTWAFRIGFAPRALRLLRMGATHGLDILYLFGTLDRGPGRLAMALGPRRVTAAVSVALQDRWVRFCQVGDPGWERYSIGRRETLRFDAQPHSVVDPDPELRAVWEGYRFYR